MANESAAEFRVMAKSRFEKSFAGYDQDSHKYHLGYVNPQTRRIVLEASSTEPPKDAIAYEWSVRQKTTGRVFRDTRKRSDEMTKTGFNVPALGEYECTLTVRFKTGKPVSKTRSFRLRSDFLIVSIGDSYASGEGNPDKPGKPADFDPGASGLEWFNPLNWVKFLAEAVDWGWNYLKREFTTLSAAFDASIDMDPKPVWLEKNAHRSLQSGPAIAAGKLESISQGELVTFLSFARSGAEIEAGLLGPRTEDGKPIDGWIGNIGQIEEVRRTVGRQRIDALVISIGGNDVGFAGSLKDLMSDNPAINSISSLTLKGGDDTKIREAARAAAQRAISRLDAKFDKLASAMVDAKLNVGHVFLTEYPTGLFDNSKKEPVAGCGIFSSDFDVDITAADAKVIRDAAAALNEKLSSIAKKHGWTYVSGIADGFAGHGYCTGRSTFFVAAEESMVIQGDTRGVMHPNPRGHRLIARQIDGALRLALKTKTGKPRTKPEPRTRPRGDVKVIDHRST